LKHVVIVAVEDGDADRRTRQPPRGVEAAETGADDDYTGFRVQGSGFRVQGSKVPEFKSSRVQEFKSARVQVCQIH
jgi:hypothetical protein